MLGSRPHVFRLGQKSTFLNADRFAPRSAARKTSEYQVGLSARRVRHSQLQRFLQRSEIEGQPTSVDQFALEHISEERHETGSLFDMRVQIVRKDNAI